MPSDLSAFDALLRTRHIGVSSRFAEQARVIACRLPGEQPEYDWNRYLFLKYAFLSLCMNVYGTKMRILLERQAYYLLSFCIL